MMNPYSISEIEGFCARYYTLPGGGPRPLSIVPYGYNVTFSALTAATVQTQQINIAANADFVALGLRSRAVIGVGVGLNVGTIGVPFARLLITDTGSNEQFTNTAVDLQNYAPSQPYPMALPYPRIVSGRSVLSCTLTAYAPAAETITSVDVFVYGVLVRAYA